MLQTFLEFLFWLEIEWQMDLYHFCFRCTNAYRKTFFLLLWTTYSKPLKILCIRVKKYVAWN